MSRFTNIVKGATLGSVDKALAACGSFDEKHGVTDKVTNLKETTKEKARKAKGKTKDLADRLEEKGREFQAPRLQGPLHDVDMTRVWDRLEAAQKDRKED